MAHPATFVTNLRQAVREFRKAQEAAVFAIRPYTAHGGANWEELGDFFTEGNGGDLSQGDVTAFISSLETIDTFIKANFHHDNLDKA